MPIADYFYQTKWAMVNIRLDPLVNFLVVSYSYTVLFYDVVHFLIRSFTIAGL